MPVNTWMVRAGENSVFVEEFQSKSCVAIGWAELADLSQVRTRDDGRNGYAGIDPVAAVLWPAM